MEAPEKRSEPLAGCVLRVFWMVPGNMALFFCAFFIGDKPAAFLRFSGLDIAYGAVVGALLAARYIDIRYQNGATMFGAPASMTHYRRYALILIAASIGVWVAAHGIAALRA